MYCPLEVAHLGDSHAVVGFVEEPRKPLNANSFAAELPNPFKLSVISLIFPAIAPKWGRARRISFGTCGVNGAAPGIVGTEQQTARKQTVQERG